MWKKIFGKKDIPQKEISKLLYEVKNDEYHLYPILKPGDWVGIKSGAVYQSLIGEKPNLDLVVGFGYDTDTNFVFLTYDQLKTMDAHKTIETAYNNIQNYESVLKPSQLLSSKILTASGKDFSSEKILDQGFMQEAHRLLDADQLVVSVPRRRCLMIAPKSIDKETTAAFINLHYNAFDDDSYGNAPVYENLLILENGKMVSYIDLSKLTQQ